jgi:hypothetical protein
MYHGNYTILTDADGVLLNWRDSFDYYMMKEHNIFAEGDVRTYDQTVRYNMPFEDMQRYILQFNNSSNIGFLPPLYDSVKYVNKLYELGYTFVVITSLSLNPYSQELRTRNLKTIFGDAMREIIYLDTAAEKDDILEEYSDYYPGHYWIEDKVKNAFVGAKFGFDSLLLKHPYTKLEDTTGIAVMSNWKSIYERITGE